VVLGLDVMAVREVGVMGGFLVVAVVVVLVGLVVMLGSVLVVLGGVSVMLGSGMRVFHGQPPVRRRNSRHAVAAMAAP
jgi:hypothetical protein